jgi:hypothetical protein
LAGDHTPRDVLSPNLLREVVPEPAHWQSTVTQVKQQLLGVGQGRGNRL